MAETVFTYYGFAVTTRNGHCCRCGRFPGVRQRLHILVDETKQELLEYGIDCWPLNMLPALQKAIQEERDEERKKVMQANFARFSRLNDAETISEPDGKTLRWMELQRERSMTGLTTTNKVVWTVKATNFKIVGTFDYTEKAEAEALVSKLMSEGKGEHFVSKEKVPMLS
jgi:hypothetical protein